MDSRSMLRCFERAFVRERAPTKLIVFDFDETLTIATLLPKSTVALSEERLQRCVQLSFESPFLEGADRLRCLDAMLEALSRGPDGERRTLAVLTKNSAGLRALVRMLRAAGLERHFSALWSTRIGAEESGAFRAADGSWEFFRPTAEALSEEKADIVHHIAEHTELWFPQLRSSDSELEHLRTLAVDSVVLVDDSPKNFQSMATGRQVGRCVEVPRFVADFRNLTSATIGGIGARSSGDYEALVDFVDSPWLHRQ